MTQPYSICLIPLDERPVNTRYPQMLAAIADIDLRLPPAEIQGLGRDPAPLDRVLPWLKAQSEECLGAIVSCEFLAYGNLINARISNDSAATTIGRLSLLAEINEQCPVHAFSLITRVANANNCVEEPLYWLEWGTRFYRYARLAHRSQLGQLDQSETDELAALDAEIPADLKADWLTRRLRNHAVTLGLMDMAARGGLQSLLITSDDTSPFGFPSRERDWLKSWPALIGSTLSSRVSMYPGADEVGSALVAKLVNARDNRTPKVWIEYSHPCDTDLIAPYEDRPIRETVIGQIHGCGCVAAESPEECDFVLAVSTVSPRRTDWRPEFREGDAQLRSEAYLAFLRTIAAHQQAGRPVAFADVAYPNGADPLLADLMLGEGHGVALGEVAAYGAWNTAGNTLGVVVAQAVCALAAKLDQSALAKEAFLAHRFLEDYGYQTVVRREARDLCESRWGRRDPDPESDSEVHTVCQDIEAGLRRILTQLQGVGIGEHVSLKQGSVKLPWRRTFEVDFELIT